MGFGVWVFHQNGIFIEIGRVKIQHDPVSFSYHRTIHFADTDAAGVVYFARTLSICHEAYEEALSAAGIQLGTFFTEHAIILPITRSEASYLRPLVCSDRVRVELRPSLLDDHAFAIDYLLMKAIPRGEKRAAIARTEHVCITDSGRERTPLPLALAAWVDASG